MKKLFFYAIISSLFAINPLFAENYGCQELEYSSCCWYEGLGAGGEWLYWKARQSQMEIASNVSFSSVGGETVVNSAAMRPDFAYSNGYRVYVDYSLNRCWKVGAALTHFPSEAFNSTVAQQGGFIPINTSLFPVFGIALPSGINLSNLELNWVLDLYYLDFYINRLFCLGNLIAVEPYVGLRGLWMKQKIEMNGSNNTATLSALLTERYSGGGLLGGVNGHCQLMYGFSLVAKFGGSLIYSSLNNNYYIQIPEADSYLSEKSNYHKSHPSVDTFIGIQYLRLFCRLTYEAHIGWENHIFFHTNQFTISSDGNLTLQGLTLGGSVRF